MGRLTKQFARAPSTDRPPTQPPCGGLHTLVMIGEDSVPHRGAVVDALCALLRSPEADAATTEVAQRLLRERLYPAREGSWPGMRVDLSGAVLTDLDLSQCRVDGDLRLDNCRLRVRPGRGGLVVGGATLVRAVRFDDHAWLERATFQGPAWSNGTTFAVTPGSDRRRFAARPRSRERALVGMPGSVGPRSDSPSTSARPSSTARPGSAGPSPPGSASPAPPSTGRRGCRGAASAGTSPRPAGR